MKLKEYLRNAKDIIFQAVSGIPDDNVQDAIFSAYQKGDEALTMANSKINQAESDERYLLKEEQSADSRLLEGSPQSFYQNASNLNAGTVPDAQLPASALMTNEQIKDIAGQLANGNHTRMTFFYDQTLQVFNATVALQTDNNFNNDYRSKLDNLISNQWSLIASDHTVQAGDRVLIDMESLSLITISLPETPETGDLIMLADGSGQAGVSKSITIGRNGHKIMALDEDLNVDLPGYLMTFVYMNPVKGWVVMN